MPYPYNLRSRSRRSRSSGRRGINIYGGHHRNRYGSSNFPWRTGGSLLSAINTGFRRSVGWSRDIIRPSRIGGGDNVTDSSSESDDDMDIFESIGIIVDDLRDTHLTVDKVDLFESTNKLKHRTSEFEYSELIVRRAQEIQIAIEFNRQPEPTNDTLTIILSTGESPKEADGSLVHLHPLQEDQSDKAMWRVWVASKNENTLELVVASPADAIVGKYSIRIRTQTRAGGKVHHAIYDHPDEMYVLFNPWAEEDEVYLEPEALRQEYVSNDSGIIYFGTVHNRSGMDWHFGQFDESVLQAVMLILDSVTSMRARRSAIFVTRAVSTMINSQDDDGVLVGNWSGNYQGGTHPTEWSGSVRILQEYLEQGAMPVKYGQCWVFSGVTTAVMRCLGIPCRSVTNFDSAHDTDANMTIDMYIDRHGNHLDHLNDDSVWNFHVWNEAWFSRKDLPDGYGGWQAFDATPQETSAGQYRAGPASVQAIKNGQVYLNYDAKFIFAEVNGDKCYWVQDDNKEMQLNRLEKNAIGRFISTKAVGKDEREDITINYKHSEGSHAERIAVELACSHGTRPDTYLRHGASDDVDFQLSLPDDVYMGQDINGWVKLSNKSTRRRKVKLTLTTKLLYYTGIPVTTLSKRTLTLKLSPKEVEIHKFDVETEDYIDSLVESAHIKVYVMAKVEETGQVWASEDVLSLCLPSLQLSMISDEAEVNEKVRIGVMLANPLKQRLKNCKISIEGPSKLKKKTVELRDLGAKEVLKTQISVTPSRVGKRKFVAVFKSNLIMGASGSIVLDVKKD